MYDTCVAVKGRWVYCFILALQRFKIYLYLTVLSEAKEGEVLNLIWELPNLCMHFGRHRKWLCV